MGSRVFVTKGCRWHGPSLFERIGARLTNIRQVENVRRTPEDLPELAVRAHKLSALFARQRVPGWWWRRETDDRSGGHRLKTGSEHRYQERKDRQEHRERRRDTVGDR